LNPTTAARFLSNGIFYFWLAQKIFDVKKFLKIILFIIFLVVGFVLYSVWSLDAIEDAESEFVSYWKMEIAPNTPAGDLDEMWSRKASKMKRNAFLIFFWYSGVLYTVFFKWQKKWKYLVFILIASVLIHEEKFGGLIALIVLFMFSDEIFGLMRPDIKNSKINTTNRNQ
jgi:hypothetical protein